MSNERSKDQVDHNATRSSPELPDRSGRLTGHTDEPLKGVDPRESKRGADADEAKAAEKPGLGRAEQLNTPVSSHPSKPGKS